MEILHKRGKDNIATDALSRKDEETQVFAISIAIPYLSDEIRTEYEKNPETFSTINNLNQYPKF